MTEDRERGWHWREKLDHPLGGYYIYKCPACGAAMHGDRAHDHASAHVILGDLIRIHRRGQNGEAIHDIVTPETAARMIRDEGWQPSLGVK